MSALALVVVGLLAGALEESPSYRMPVPFSAMQPASPDECAIATTVMEDAIRTGGAPANMLGDKRVVLLDIAEGWRQPFEGGWSAPSLEVRADFLANADSRRLDQCPGLSDLLRTQGWSFGRTARDGGYYWRMSRVGFNADHTVAMVMVSSGWGGPTGDGGLLHWYRKDPADGHWKVSGSGGGWIS